MRKFLGEKNLNHTFYKNIFVSNFSNGKFFIEEENKIKERVFNCLTVRTKNIKKELNHFANDKTSVYILYSFDERKKTIRYCRRENFEFDSTKYKIPQISGLVKVSPHGLYPYKKFLGIIISDIYLDFGFSKLFNLEDKRIYLAHNDKINEISSSI